MVEVTARVSKTSEHTAAILGCLCLLAAGGLLVLAQWLPCAGALGGAFLLASAALAAAFSCLHARLSRQATEEQQRARQGGARGSDLFGEPAAGSGDRQRTLRQFEAWFCPFFAAFLAILEALMSYVLFTRLPRVDISPVESANFHLGVVLGLAVGGFLLFMVGKYAAGLGYDGRHQHLRAGAALSILSAAFVALIAVSLLLSRVAVTSDNPRWRNPDRFLLVAGALILGVLAVERVLQLVLSWYRPRGKGPGAAVLYESRVAALLAHPEGLWQGFSEFVDYQFGFTVSKGRFRRLCLRVFLPLAAFQLVALLVLSCVVGVPAAQRGFRERWGRPSDEPLAPGLHGKLPWPVERVYFAPADRVLSFEIGSNTDADETSTESYLWSALPKDAPLFITAAARAGDLRHGDKPQQDGLALARPAPVVNLVALKAVVSYQITAPDAAFYKHIAPIETLRLLAQRELIAYLATHDGLGLMSSSWEALNSSVCGRLQRLCGPAADGGLDLGMRVLSVAVTQIQPPVRGDTVAAFHQSMIEQQKAESLINEAERYRNTVVPEAKARAGTTRAAAQTYSVEKLESAHALAEVFSARHELYRTHGRLYRTLSYLDHVERALAGTSKVVLATDVSDQMISVDLKSEFNPEVLDMIGPAESREE